MDFFKRSRCKPPPSSGFGLKDRPRHYLGDIAAASIGRNNRRPFDSDGAQDDNVIRMRTVKERTLEDPVRFLHALWNAGGRIVKCVTDFENQSRR